MPLKIQSNYAHGENARSNPLFEPTRSGTAQIGLHFILGQFALRLRGRLNSTLGILREIMEPTSIFASVTAICALIKEFVTGREKRRIALFNGLIKPAFDDFVKVHEKYRAIFLSLERRIEASASDEAFGQRKALINEVNALRSESKELRWLLRSECKALLNLFDKVEEQRFLVALALYFIDQEDGGRPKRPEELDYGWTLLVKDKGSDALPTPSMNLIDHLNNKISDELAFHKEVADSLERLDQRHWLVRHAFIDIKFLILNLGQNSNNGVSAKDA